MMMMVMAIWGGYIIALFVHLVTLLMGRAREVRWSGIAGRISLLEAGKGGSRSYGAQRARTSSGRFVMGRGWFLVGIGVEYYVGKWVELL
jgi:hypothetical protein